MVDYLGKRIPKGEPVFVLRASDPAAPHAIEAWADAYRSAVDLSASNDHERMEAKAVARRAVSFAVDMILWRRAHASK